MYGCICGVVPEWSVGQFVGVDEYSSYPDNKVMSEPGIQSCVSISGHSRPSSQSGREYLPRYLVEGTTEA